MSTNKITWRPATADDVGRLARFKGSTNSDGFVYDTIVAWNGERFVASSRFAYPRCEVQDVEAEEVGSLATRVADIIKHLSHFRDVFGSTEVSINVVCDALRKALTESGSTSDE